MLPLPAQRLLAGLAAAVVALQIIQFVPFELRLRPYTSALHRYETDDLIEVSLRDDPNPMSRYSAWVALAEIAPHSTLYYPVSGDRSEPHRVYGFGLVDEVIVLPYTDGNLPHDSDFKEYVVAQGPGAGNGPPWFIALDPANGTGGDPENPESFLPRALEDGNRLSNPGPPREFVRLRWRGAPVNPEAAQDYNYYAVLMETSLLTDELRTQLGLDAAPAEGGE